MSRLLLRIMLGMLVVLLGSWLIVGWGFAVGRERALRNDVSLLLDRLLEVRGRLAGATASELPARLAELRGHIPYPLTIVALSAVPEVVRARAAKGVAVRFVRHEGPEIYLPLKKSRQVLRLGPLGSFFEHGAYPAVVVLGGIIATILLVGFVVAFPLVRRLRRLELAAERIAAGDLTARAGIASKDAIGSLARRFDAMAGQIETLLRDQRELLQAVSHELRTPAARLRFGLEMLASDDDDESRAKRIAALEADIDELDALVGELLLYVRLGASTAEPRSAINVGQTLRDVAQRLGEIYPKIAIELPKDASPDATCEVDAIPRYLERALGNLLKNALEHAQERVIVQIAVEGTVLRVDVDDDGPGIPKAARERIFEPFARLDESRSRESGGAGLGLAIVQRIARAHDGSVAAFESPLGGARLTSRWPLAQSTKRSSARSLETRKKRATMP